MNEICLSVTGFEHRLLGSPKNIGDPTHFSGVSPTIPEALLTFLVS